MSLREGLVVFVACMVAGISAQAAENGVVTCPATITAAESAHRFERISVYNGKPGGQEYELAPDESSTLKGEITQKWDLSAYRSMNLFLRCRYSGTSAVLVRDLPAPLRTCTFRFSMDSKGKIMGKSEMECR